MEKVKNEILMMVTRIAALVLVVSVCCLDSASTLPLVAFCASLAWLSLFMIANDDNVEVIIKKSWLLK